MAKPDQVLIIEPRHELKFTGPFTVPVTSYMKLKNPTTKNVLFKIKTTAPKKYCVRPNSGVLLPNDEIELAICLQPFIYNASDKNKHKFMVQSTFWAGSVEDINFDHVWKLTPPDELMDSKLKCVFELGSANADIGEEAPKAETKAPVASAAMVPSVGSPNANTSIQNELQKAATQVKLLREEESNLRSENLRLKEELLRLKYVANPKEGGNAEDRNVRGESWHPRPPGDREIYLIRIGVTILLAIIGVILGKYAL